MWEWPHVHVDSSTLLLSIPPAPVEPQKVSSIHGSCSELSTLLRVAFKSHTFIGSTQLNRGRCWNELVENCSSVTQAAFLWFFAFKSEKKMSRLRRWNKRFGREEKKRGRNWPPADDQEDDDDDDVQTQQQLEAKDVWGKEQRRRWRSERHWWDFLWFSQREAEETSRCFHLYLLCSPLQLLSVS